MGNDLVEFGNKKLIAVLGIFGGVALAVGLPALVLIHGQALGPTVQVIIILAALAMGGTAVLTASFFGLIIPSRVDDSVRDLAGRASKPARRATGSGRKKTRK